MPLNIQDSEEQKGPTPPKPVVPLTPAEPESTGGARKLLLWIFALVVLASAFFLMIQFGVLPGGGEPTGSPAVTMPAAVETTAVPVESPAAADPGVEKADSERAAGLRQRLASGGGEYAIFISAFNAATDAEELAGRWERAGYKPFVQHAGGWYRVALGGYPTVAIAREEAEKLRQALEEGYWIGRSTLE
jgi:septal ring-binding cell division protein DamX